MLLGLVFDGAELGNRSKIKKIKDEGKLLIVLLLFTNKLESVSLY